MPAASAGISFAAALWFGFLCAVGCLGAAERRLFAGGKGAAGPRCAELM